MRREAERERDELELSNQVGACCFMSVVKQIVVQSGWNMVNNFGGGYYNRQVGS